MIVLTSHAGGGRFPVVAEPIIELNGTRAMTDPEHRRAERRADYQINRLRDQAGLFPGRVGGVGWVNRWVAKAG
jgi:hypothetical protein